MAHTPSSGNRAELPIPTREALAHSARVVAHIERMIATSGGWISFADYMGAALYAPGLGYSVAGSRKFGPAGDFVTAPELTALFGETLAAQIEAVLVQLPGSSVIELGPGTGRLAADVLAALASREALPERYWLLEVSPDLRERQRAHLLDRVPELLPRVEWIDVLPGHWRGALLIFDYGFPASEYYHPQRNGGTVMTHYRHRTVDDPFFLPGLADLTAHVDFSAIAHAGVAGGMALTGYATQARFLINCGILD